MHQKTPFKKLSRQNYQGFIITLHQTNIDFGEAITHTHKH